MTFKAEKLGARRVSRALARRRAPFLRARHRTTRGHQRAAVASSRPSLSLGHCLRTSWLAGHRLALGALSRARFSRRPLPAALQTATQRRASRGAYSAQLTARCRSLKRAKRSRNNRKVGRNEHVSFCYTVPTKVLVQALSKRRGYMFAPTYLAATCLLKRLFFFLRF